MTFFWDTLTGAFQGTIRAGIDGYTLLQETPYRTQTNRNFFP